MLQEINLFGVCVSPFIIHLLLAAVLFFACRGALAHTGLLSRLWQPPLVELSLFVTLLTLVAYQ